MLTREQILAADDLQRIEVEVPEWGGSVALRVMTGAEEEWFAEFVGTDPERNVPKLRETLLAMTLCDEEGGRLFDVQEVEALSNKSGDIIKRLFEAARDLNKLGTAEVDAAIKNSEPTPDASSGIASRPSLEDAVSGSGSAASTLES